MYDKRKTGDTLPINSVFEYDGDKVPEGYKEVEEESTLKYENVDTCNIMNGSVRYIVNNGVAIVRFCKAHFTQEVDQSVMLAIGLPKVKFSGVEVFIIHSNCNNSIVRLVINEKGELRTYWNNTKINNTGDEFNREIIYVVSD